MSDPFFEMIPLCAALAGACWLLSVVTREYSWVDRLWSVAPPLYLWLMAWRDGFSDARLLLMTALATLWGVRLTYNFARKGGYRRGGEDYRWVALRERLGPRWFQVFNFVFIAPVQNVVLLLITAPASAVWVAHAPLTTLDGMLALAFVFCLVGETVADEQQWRFQQAKAARRARGEAGPEYLTEGLFRLSRHPNYFFELSQWWVLYGFAVVATGRWLHWSIVGPALLTLIFEGSTRFTERLSIAKYPRYVDYQARTSRWLPWPSTPQTQASKASL
jgi:steroid 5-alpha reductase family enzyme